MDKIFIIGTGAIGRALAVFLKQQQRDVVLLRGSIDNIETHTEEIEVTLNDNSALKSQVEVSTLSNYQTLQGIIVLTNKSFGNLTIAEALKNKTGSSPIVILQNGLNVEQPFLDDFPIVYRCVLFATSQNMSQVMLRFKPVSVSPIGVVKGDASQLERVVKALDNTHFRFKAVDDIQTIIWKKAIANCVFNSICPLLDTDNGIFHRHPGALSIGKLVIDECIVIAQTIGIRLEQSDVLEMVLLISKSSDGQLISTLQDIRNRRETEIESLNFAIVKVAAENNKEHLVSTTKILGELTKVKASLALA
jgi:2-dehydropantoate 2-reductase